jgi:hypothetical protein
MWYRSYLSVLLLCDNCFIFHFLQVFVIISPCQFVPVSQTIKSQGTFPPLAGQGCGCTHKILVGICCAGQVTPMLPKEPESQTLARGIHHQLEWIGFVFCDSSGYLYECLNNSWMDRVMNPLFCWAFPSFWPKSSAGPPNSFFLKGTGGERPLLRSYIKR